MRRKMNKLKRYMFIICIPMLLILLATSCRNQYQTLIIACDYDKENNLTVFTIAPDGNIEIPGMWEYSGRYIPQSQQHFLRNPDGTLLIIAKIPENRKPNKSEIGNEFKALKAYYKWETDYFKKEKGIKIDLIQENKKQCFILYDMDNTLAFICGFKKGFFYNFSIQEGEWTLKKKHNFLKALYLNN
jgi:hypothetical protein